MNDIKEIRWTEVFFGLKTLKDLRTQNNLEIPEWYNKSVLKMTMAFGVIMAVLGAGLGFVLSIIINGVTT